MVLPVILSAVALLSLQGPVQRPAPQPNAMPAEQQAPEAPSPQGLPDTSDADISIEATVTIEEMTFEAVPNPTVEFTGSPGRRTVWETERINLPKPVQPGVIYRDVTVKLVIASWFDDVDRTVVEILRVSPGSDASPAPPVEPGAERPR